MTGNKDQSLLELIDQQAASLAKARGFQSLGIYHLLWAMKQLDEGVYLALLAAYNIDTNVFTKMVENVLRPRKAGGGIPRDKQEQQIANQALQQAMQLAESKKEEATCSHLAAVITQLKEDPIISLCERFDISYQKPC